MTNIKPKKFFGLHGHDNFSVYDGLGLPRDHIDFVMENTREEGIIPGMAITNHGNMNSYAHAYLYVKELLKAGKTFKFCPGVEAYVHPDLNEWRKLRAAKEDDSDDEAEHKSIVENEEESKSNKRTDPIGRKHHLVLLAKNSKGLQSLFSLVSKSSLEGFYKKPRMDYAMIKKHKGDLIASTACISGPLGYDIFSEFPDAVFDISDVTHKSAQFLGPHLLDDPAVMERVMRKLSNTLDRLVDAIGIENFFLELQFNKLTSQALVNRALLELSKRSGVKLTATADSHYYRPDVWREREIYKRLGWLNHVEYNPDLLPKTVDDLKCELYPKNAAQMWEAYKKNATIYNFYDDQIICDAIERSYDIATELIDDVKPDTSTKLPSWCIPKGKTAHQALTEACDIGMKRLGLNGKKEYDERLAYELEVVEFKKFSEYFLTMKMIIDVAHENMLVGCGRGCFVPESRVLLADASFCDISKIKIGDEVLDAYGTPQKVIDVYQYDVDEELLELNIDGIIIKCTQDHEFLTDRGWVHAKDLLETDDIQSI